MSRTITRIRLPFDPEMFNIGGTFELPRHGQTIFVGLDRGMPAIWMMSDSDDAMSIRRFRLRHDERAFDVPEDCFYVGTCVNASQIIHILEVR